MMIPALPKKSPAQGGKRWSRPNMLRWLQRAAAAVIIIVLVTIVGPTELVRSLSRIHPGWALITTLALACLISIGGINVWVLLRKISPAGLRNFFWAYLAAWAIGLISPGQLGDASQVLFLKQQGIKYSQSSAAYLLDKVISLGILMLVAVCGLFLYKPFGDWNWFSSLNILPVLFVLCSLPVILILAKSPYSPAVRVRTITANLLLQLLEFRKHRQTVVLNVILTVVKWFILTLCYYLAFKTFSTNISMKATAFIPIMSTFVGYIPITAGGVGTVEAAAIFLFGLEGIGQSVVLGTYFFIRLVYYGGALIVLFVLEVKERHRKYPLNKSIK